MSQPRPAEGILINGSVLARILGLRLLRLEARITVTAAEVPDQQRPLRLTALDRDLAEAVQGMDERAELLARARRNGI